MTSNIHNKTFTNPYRRGSPFRPTFAQREHSIEHYLSDHPYATYLEAAKIIDTLSKDWIEEHI